MDGISPIIFLRPLAAIVLAVSPTVRKLHAERTAGRAPVSLDPDSDPLNDILGGALNRLGAIEDNKSWWKDLLTGTVKTYTRPDFFELPSVRDWLSEEQVKTDLKTLARARLIGEDLDTETLARLRKRYCVATGESEFWGTYAIAIVIAVLQASAHGVLTSGQGVLHGSIKDLSISSAQRGLASEQRDQKVLDGIEQLKAGFPRTEDAVYGSVLQKELEHILKRRAIPGVKSDEKIEALIYRFENDDLSLAPAFDKADAYYWGARILAPDAKKATTAQAYLEKYQALTSADSNNVAFIEAWLMEASGDRQGAIEIFSSLDTPDARTSLFILISKRDGNPAALEWLDNNQPFEHKLLSPAGWRNAAILMTEEKQWQEALDLLDNLPSMMMKSFPELLFMQGFLHASLLLPEPIRIKLSGPYNIDFKNEAQEGEAASEHRSKAMKALYQARDLLLDLGVEGRASGCDYHLMWLRLTDPNEYDVALTELKEGMKDGEYATSMLDIALSFDDTFDRKPLEQYLRRRKLEGREEPQDHLIRLRLLQYFGSPKDILSHLEKESAALKDALPPATLISLKLHALIYDERISDAESELEHWADVFSPDELERHRLMFSDRKGEELVHLEALYLRTNEYEDLLNLVRYLERTQQWPSLLPHAYTLLKTRRSAGMLRTIIHAMQKTEVPSEGINAFLEEHQDLITSGTRDGDELLLSKGWALFSLGRFSEAQEIANDLAERNHEPNAISLEINLALRTGQWEHFSSIIDREFSKLNELPARLLLQMASVVADRDQDQDRAIQILTIAVDNEPEDGLIQSQAYFFASQIGREIDASTWLKRAIDLSQQGEGPMQTISLRKMTEMMPARAEQRRKWEQQYSTGEIGVHPIASLLHIPIAHILVGNSLQNESEIDPRRRSVIPTRHGGRGLTDLTDMRKIAFDLTSLLVLEHLEILQPFIDHLDGILLSPRLMDILFMEHRQVRFHQPSQVEEAERIRELISNDEIQLLRNVHPPKELVEEVGDEMASLLHEAQETGGRVLSTLPVHKAGSVDLDDADLGTYGPLILQPVQFLPHIENQMSPENYIRAKDFLSSVDRGAKLGPDELSEGPLYIDNLALRYLDTAGTLQNLRHIRHDIFVMPSVEADAKALIEGARHGDQVASVINQLRKRIRDTVQAGKVTFLPESNNREDHDEFHQTNALMDIFAFVDDADALCLDDRVIGKHANVMDGQGQNIPIVDSIDVLEHLAAQGIITAEKKRTCDFRLRKGGFAFLPLNAEDVLAALKASIDAKQTLFKEHPELVAIRENLQRIRSIKILRLPEEVVWFSNMAHVTRQLLIQVWDDSNVNIEMVEKISDWVLNVLSPLPTAWQESIILVKDEEIEVATKFVISQLIYAGLRITETDRKEAFSKWIDQRLIKPLLPVNAFLIDEIAKSTSPIISKAAKEIADGLD